MKHALLLAWRYLSFRRGRTAVLVLGIAATVLLPLAAQVLVRGYSARLGARAEATPLVAGARGSRYDLVLSTLYFKGRTPRPVFMADVDNLATSGHAEAIPLFARARARGYPVVGTTADYHTFRGLQPTEGTLPLLLGDAVLGAEVAQALGLGAGSALLTEQENLYDLAQSYPLKMHVCGVLSTTGTADDRAIFVDMKTAWVIQGVGHGHQDATTMDGEQVLATSTDGVVLNSSVREFNEITAENRASFHVHAERDELPVTGIVVVPTNRKSATILKGRYRVAERTQLVEPTEVVTELLGFVFRLKVFFDANAILVWIATVLFLAVIVGLSLEVRRREMRTLQRIGCARSTVARIVGTELLLVIGAGLVLAGVLATFVVAAVRWSVASTLR